MKMLGTKTIRNPYFATLAMALVLLPVFWTPSHSHQVGVYRAHCSACLLAIFSSTILTAAAVAVLLIRDWRAQLELPARLLLTSSPSFLGRAPPTSFLR